MAMKSILALLLLAMFAALPLSCKSTPSDVPCVCGTAMGDLDGCSHSMCRTGKNNPANPDCVCGTLDIPAKKKN